MAIPFKILELDKPYKLRFGMGATLEFEQLTGKTLNDIDNGEIDATTLLKALWIMLRQENKELTLEKVSELVDEHATSMRVVIETVTEAMMEAYKVNLPNAQQPRGK